MNSRAEIWNVLHDGDIAGIRGQVPGELALTIYIPYLRRMFSEGTCLELTLKECSQFSMEIWDQKLVTSDLAKIVEAKTEILSTESMDAPVRIITTQGEIVADFAAFSIALDNGVEISFEELCGACGRYWEGWQRGEHRN